MANVNMLSMMPTSFMTMNVFLVCMKAVITMIMHVPTIMSTSMMTVNVFSGKGTTHKVMVMTEVLVSKVAASRTMTMYMNVIAIVWAMIVLVNMDTIMSTVLIMEVKMLMFMRTPFMNVLMVINKGNVYIMMMNVKVSSVMRAAMMFMYMFFSVTALISVDMQMDAIMRTMLMVMYISGSVGAFTVYVTLPNMHMFTIMGASMMTVDVLPVMSTIVAMDMQVVSFMITAMMVMNIVISIGTNAGAM